MYTTTVWFWDTFLLCEINRGNLLSVDVLYCGHFQEFGRCAFPKNFLWGVKFISLAIYLVVKVIKCVPFQQYSVKGIS